MPARSRTKPRTATFHTPMFMPVGTSATVKGITVDQLRQLDSQVVLANTYHLSMRPGADLVAEAGGVHQLHELRRPHAHRLRRIPGVLAGRHR